MLVRRSLHFFLFLKRCFYFLAIFINCASGICKLLARTFEALELPSLLVSCSAKTSLRGFSFLFSTFCKHLCSAQALQLKLFQVQTGTRPRHHAHVVEASLMWAKHSLSPHAEASGSLFRLTQQKFQEAQLGACDRANGQHLDIGTFSSFFHCFANKLLQTFLKSRKAADRWSRMLSMRPRHVPHTIVCLKRLSRQHLF